MVHHDAQRCSTAFLKSAHSEANIARSASGLSGLMGLPSTEGGSHEYAETLDRLEGTESTWVAVFSGAHVAVNGRGEVSAMLQANGTSQRPSRLARQGRALQL